MTLLFKLACVKHKQKVFDRVGHDLQPHWEKAETKPEVLKRNPLALIDQQAARAGCGTLPCTPEPELTAKHS